MQATLSCAASFTVEAAFRDAAELRELRDLLGCEAAADSQGPAARRQAFEEVAFRDVDVNIVFTELEGTTLARIQLSWQAFAHRLVHRAVLAPRIDLAPRVDSTVLTNTVQRDGTQIGLGGFGEVRIGHARHAIQVSACILCTTCLHPHRNLRGTQRPPDVHAVRMCVKAFVRFALAAILAAAGSVSAAAATCARRQVPQ